MSREKQIEEMTKIAKNAIDNQSIDKCPSTPCRYRGNSVCCDVCLTIEALYNEDYRKQTEVAREIFTELERLYIHITNEFDMRRYSELKKKYTEDRQ